METFLNLALPLLSVLLPAIGTLLVAFLTYATTWIRSKTRSANARAAIDLAAQIVEDVKDDVERTVVARMKTIEGEWTPEAAAAIKLDAVKAVKRNLGPDNLRRLNDALGGAAADWLATRLEASITREKRPDVLR